MPKKLTVLSAEFMHESNTFSRYRTDLPQFEADTLYYGEDAIRARRHANTELAGFIDAADELGWSLLHTVSAHAVPGGQVTRTAFDHIAGVILDAARQHRDDIGGVILGLHGAMVPEFCQV